MLKGFLSKLNQNALVPVKNELRDSLAIPEPTRSLLFFTDEDISNAELAGSLSIVISVGHDGVESEVDKHTNLNAEPSMIWTQLPVHKNSDLEESPMYYPAYTTLIPNQRYQYLMWLRDVTQQTNLSYVFLYYYGLERHLLLGDFDIAANEVLRLLKSHDKGSFRAYSETALLTAMIYRKRFDFLNDQDFTFQNISNELLMIRKGLQMSLAAKELMKISSWLGFRSRHYINKVPDEFEKTLEAVLSKYEVENDLILNCVSNDELEHYKANCFANLSIPDKVRSVRVPDFIKNEKFSSLACSLLQETHEILKEQKKSKRKT